MRKAIYPGSFDPVHPGHLYVIEQASKMFDEVIVIVAENPSKKYDVSANVRLTFIDALVSDFKNVRVDITNKTLAEYCKAYDVHFVIRGLRNGNDLEYERAQEFYTKQLAGDFDLNYVYINTPSKLMNYSSTFMKQFKKYSTKEQFRNLFRDGWALRSEDVSLIDLMYDVYSGNYIAYADKFYFGEK